MKWPVEVIGVVAQVNPRLAAADRPDLEDRVSFVPMAAVSEETVSIETQAVRPFSEVSKGYTPFKRGDVLVAKITPCFENGKMAMADNLAFEIGFGTTEFHVFRPSERITGSYLFNLLRAPYVRKAGAMRMKGAAGQRRVPADFFAALQIPLPPLDEQKRIASILDAADALRAKRREALGELDTLLQSTFLDMFGDPVTNPMGWEVTTVNGIGSVQGGLQVTSKRRSLPIERPYLRVANVFRGFLRLDELKTIRLTKAEELRTSLEYEDILIVEGHGNKEEIGRCARWDGSIAPCVHQNHLIRLRCDRSKVAPIYVENYINSPGGRRSLTGTSRTTSGLNTISVSKVRGSEIQLPPIDLQHHFAAIVESVEQQRARQRAHLAELDTLFASLQSRAFQGDL